MSISGNGEGHSTRMVASDQNASWLDLVKLGGISAILSGVFYILATALVFIMPFPPTSGGAATLDYIASNRSAYIVEQVLYNVPGILAVAVFPALYILLRPINRSYAAIGALISIVAWVPPALAALDLTGGLVNLSDQYAAATNELGRTTFATAAEALVAQTNIVFAAGILEAIGILIVSWVMLKGTFSRRVAYLGIVTGVLGIVSEGLRTIMGAGYILYGVLLIVWFIVIGRELLRMTSISSDNTAQSVGWKS